MRFKAPVELHKSAVMAALNKYCAAHQRSITAEKLIVEMGLPVSTGIVTQAFALLNALSDRSDNQIETHRNQSAGVHFWDHSAVAGGALCAL